MHKAILAAAMALMATPCLATDLDTILAENHKAHGGDAYDQIHAVRARLLIKEPTVEFEGVYTASREGLMRIDIYSEGQRVYAEGLMETPDGPEDMCAWEWYPGMTAEDSAKCVGETEAAALRHGLEMPGHFYTLQDVRERGATVELIGEAHNEHADKGGAEWQIRVTLPDGFSRDYFIDQESHRLTRGRDKRAFHPGIDATEITVETRVSEPFMLDGVLRSRRQESYNVETGEWLNTTLVLLAEHNPEIVEGMFEPTWEAPKSPSP